MEPNDILLDVIREKLGVKSPKYGCGKGDCGTCTVLLNGEPVRSCIILAIEADGQKITTVEGIMKGGRPRPLQDSFIEAQLVPVRLLRARDDPDRHRLFEEESQADPGGSPGGDRRQPLPLHRLHRHHRRHHGSGEKIVNFTMKYMKNMKGKIFND